MKRELVWSALTFVLGCGPAPQGTESVAEPMAPEETAQELSYCRQAEERYQSQHGRNENIIEFTTRAALAEVTAARLTEGLEDPQGTRNRILDRQPPVPSSPRPDQELVVRCMEVEYCRVIFSLPGQSDQAKLDRYNKVVEAIWAKPSYAALETTRSQGQAPQALHETRRSTRQGVIMLASLGPPSTDSPPLAATPAASSTEADEPEGEHDFLADPPFFVNDTNKYFVIVASPTSREEGIRLMRRFKAQAPQHDFALYPQYLDNPNLAVMMASWVSKDVAYKARELARRDVADDAYIWCFPSGPCGSGAQ